MDKRNQGRNGTAWFDQNDESWGMPFDRLRTVRSQIQSQVDGSSRHFQDCSVPTWSRRSRPSTLSRERALGDWSDLWSQDGHRLDHPAPIRLTAAGQSHDKVFGLCSKLPKPSSWAGECNLPSYGAEAQAMPDRRLWMTGPKAYRPGKTSPADPASRRPDYVSQEPAKRVVLLTPRTTSNRLQMSSMATSISFSLPSPQTRQLLVNAYAQE
ncbi:hypothetical protein CROQUDRAFT_109404 [Cronartium quercuum f. sp. fusiforme G11]|uniref:Uncharacterized protein n=1 Tax=Cronartium quercuum f. sp. fusiforme G11 TaxID=708437 RepID=A0A9P6NC32_9BASI|nr:hypothetical protein CROQUDRAFT_109404 [Cronartium quercuum f. sp. fusiforme G11]